MQNQQIITLAGQWACRLDPEGCGGSQRWHEDHLTQYVVALPGTTQTNGLGGPAKKQLISDLTPEHEEVPIAWYERSFELSDLDCARHVSLYLERCGWVSSVWLNGIGIGTQESLVAPHVYNLCQAVKPGLNRLTIRIDISNQKEGSEVSSKDGSECEDLVMEAEVGKRLNCGGHHTVFGGPGWNGITGRMEVQIRESLHIADLQAYPDVANRQIRVALTCVNDLDAPRQADVHLQVVDPASGSVVAEHHWNTALPPGKNQEEHRLEFDGEIRLWDEFTPHLYNLKAELKTDTGCDNQETIFGMRELSQIGTQLAINGRPTFLRGALENFVHPLTGHPPTDLADWLHLFGVSKAHGLNHLRFHTCCPPEAAFVAADRLGLILNVELPGCSGGEADDSDTLVYLEAEALRILKTFGNHPSFCMLTMGNELLGNSESCAIAQQRLMARVARCREVDGRHWYCCTAHSHTEGRDDDFYVSAWPKEAHGYGNKETEGEPLTGIRWSGFDVVDSSRFNTLPPETASDYRDGIAGIDKPLITHEVGQWAVYPDIREIDRYTGVMKPYNLEIIRDFMREKGTLHLADDFVRASGELSLLLYKEEIESALRTPGLAGFQLLGFHDHPPQGTSTIGIVNALREAKGIVTPQKFRQFCSEIVPLARLKRRTFTAEDDFTTDVDIAHAGPEDLCCAAFDWRLTSTPDKVIAQGQFDPADIPRGSLTRLGSIAAPLAAIATPSKAVLTVFLDGTPVSNSWDLWVYPRQALRREASTLWSRGWDADIAGKVADGATAIIELPPEQIPGATRGCMTSLFWNPIMKRHQESFTMGVLCDPAHPALAAFPTECHSNWQWWDVLRPSKVLDLDSMSPRPEPVVRMIDSFIGNRCLSVIFEARIGQGRVLVTSLDLSSDLPARHAARQLRFSLEEYVVSTAFSPDVKIKPEALDNLLKLHQQKTNPKESRDEIKNRFDRIVHGSVNSS